MPVHPTHRSPATLDGICAACGKNFLMWGCAPRECCSPRCARSVLPVRPVCERLWSKVDKSGDCWLWTGHRNPDGYGRMLVSKRTGKIVMTHRLAWECTSGPIPDELRVLHRCDNPPCCNPAHLFIGSQAENIADMHAKGRYHKPGSAGGQAGRGVIKLQPDHVRAIRARYAAGGISMKALGAEFDVCAETVHGIVRGTVWRHIV